MKPTTYEKNKYYTGYHPRHNHMELCKLQSRTRRKDPNFTRISILKLSQRIWY